MEQKLIRYSPRLKPEFFVSSNLTCSTIFINPLNEALLWFIKISRKRPI